MKSYNITFFRTLNKPESNITVEKYIELLKNGFVKDRILKIRRLEEEKRKSEAENIKKASSFS